MFHCYRTIPEIAHLLCIITANSKSLLFYFYCKLNIGFSSNLTFQCGQAGDAPDPYVKTYLLPDPMKTTKRKTKIAKETFHPTYNEMVSFGNFENLTTRMHSSRMRTARTFPYGGLPDRDHPLDRDPPGQRPPGQGPPRTEIPPPDRDPP